MFRLNKKQQKQSSDTPDNIDVYVYYPTIFTGKNYKQIKEYFVPAFGLYFNANDHGKATKPRCTLNFNATGTASAISVKKLPHDLIKQIHDSLNEGWGHFDPDDADMFNRLTKNPTEVHEQTLPSGTQCFRYPLTVNPFTENYARYGNEVLKLALEAYVLTGALPTNISEAYLKDITGYLNDVEKANLLYCMDMEIVKSGAIRQTGSMLGSIPGYLSIPCGMGAVALAAGAGATTEDSQGLGLAAGAIVFGTMFFRDATRNKTVEDRNERLKEIKTWLQPTPKQDETAGAACKACGK